MFSSLIQKYNIILASKSPRRHLLLKGLDISFEVVQNDVEEKWPLNLEPKEIPAYLAKLKADKYSNNFAPNDILITADTAVIFEGQILNKPKDRDEAESMLKLMSGKPHDVITGVCLTSDKKQVVFEDSTRVYFKDLNQKEISYYLDNYQPYDKAGSYGAQEWIGYIGIERLEGSYFNVMGLPVRMVYKYLLKLISN